VIDAMVNHPSVSEFICVKLINKFVSDEISLVVLSCQHSAICDWAIGERCYCGVALDDSGRQHQNCHALILNPSTQTNYFWSGGATDQK
jgi:hypothetical protein